MKWYEIKNINEIDTPALIVFPDRIKANLQEAISMVGDVNRLRPHIKTHKSIEAAQLMLQAGITKFKCATIAEAELLGSLNAPDVLIAYPLVGPKINRFFRLIEKFPLTRYSCLVDNIQPSILLNEQALADNKKIEVFIDIDNGMHRTGINADAGAIELFHTCIQSKALKVRGFHAYDGHIRDMDIAQRKVNSDKAFDAVLHLKQSLAKYSDDPIEIICGGSPTFPIHADRSEVECSPGTFIYWDQGYSDVYEGRSFLPAAVLITRVISKINEVQITCDLGHKSVASENDITHRVYFLNANGLQPVSQSEEHLVLKLPLGADHSIGDVLYGIPHHICPTVALYEKVYTASDHVVSGEWKNVARDRKLTV